MIKNLIKLANLFSKLAEKVYNCRYCGAPHRSVDPGGFICGQCGTANRPKKDTFKELFEDKQEIKEPAKEKQEKFKAEKCPLCEHSHDDCFDLNCNCDYQECAECGYDHAYEPEEASRVHKQLKFKEYQDEFPYDDEFPYEKFAAGVARSKKERGISCVKADNPQNASHLDKFPVNKLSEAKAALKRMSITTKAPKWWKGSLDELKNLVMKVVAANYKVETKDGKIVVTNKT